MVFISLKLLGLRIVMILLVLLPLETLAAEYFIRNGGNDDNDGLSDKTAWASIRRVNQFRFSDGDTICLKRGSIFKDDTLRSPDVNNFTIRDYGNGNKPIIDANYIKPIEIHSRKTINNLKIVNIDISGSNWTTSKATALSVINVSGLILDGIYGNGHRDGGKYGKNAIFIGGTTSQNACTGRIEIKNSELFNYGPENILTKGIDFIGIVLGQISSGTISVHSNRIYNITADCVQIFRCTAQASFHDNTFYNAGENAVDVKSSSNISITNNKLYRTPGFAGDGGSGGGSIVGIHDPYKQGDIANIEVSGNIFKGEDRNNINVSNVRNVIIYNNYFSDGTGRGVKVARAKNVRIFQNRFERISGNILIQRATENLEIYDNVFLKPNKNELEDGVDGCCIYENNDADEVTKIYNNTFYGTRSCRHLIAIQSSKGTIIKNNIFYQDNGERSAFPVFIGNYGLTPHIIDNCMFNKNKESAFSHKNTSDIAKQTHSMLLREHNLYADPLFSNATEGNLSIPPSSPCLGKGSTYEKILFPSPYLAR